MEGTERIVLAVLSALSGLFVGLPTALFMGSTPAVRIGVAAAVAVLFAGILYFGFKAALGGEGEEA